MGAENRPVFSPNVCAATKSAQTTLKYFHYLMRKLLPQEKKNTFGFFFHMFFIKKAR